MFCRNCGTKLEEGAKLCPQCAYVVASEYNYTYKERTSENKQNLNMNKENVHQYNVATKDNDSVMYIVLSAIESAICCQPLGIISLVLSILAYDAFKVGNDEKALKYLKTAKILLIVGICIFLLLVVGYFLFLFIMMSSLGSGGYYY